MTKPYPDPVINSSTDIISYANTVTKGWMTILFCMSAFILMFLLLKTKGYRTSDSLFASSFLTFMMSSFLWGMSALSGKIVLFFLLALVLSALYSMLDR